MRSTILAAVCIGLIIVIAAGLLAMRSRPVVYAFTESGDSMGEPSVTLFNPFRDRAPERAAESVLRHLERKEYEEAMSKILDVGASKAEIAANERRFQLRSWKLANRTSKDGTTTLFYRTARGASTREDSSLWISVQRDGTSWKVTGFDAWY